MKPYVSYRAPQVKIPPMTAERLLEELRSNIDIVQHTEVPWKKDIHLFIVYLL